jgi:hypothetical protein
MPDASCSAERSGSVYASCSLVDQATFGEQIQKLVEFEFIDVRAAGQGRDLFIPAG